MNVIIVSKYLKAPKKISFGSPKVAAIAGGVLLAGLGLAFAAGYSLRNSDAVADAQNARNLAFIGIGIGVIGLLVGAGAWLSRPKGSEAVRRPSTTSTEHA